MRVTSKTTAFVWALALQFAAPALADDPLPHGAIARLGTARFRHENYVISLAYAPDGKTLISAGADRTIRVWDTADGKPLLRVEAPQRIVSLAVAANGVLGASVDIGNTIAVHELATGMTVARIEKYRRERELVSRYYEACRVAISPDSRLLAVARTEPQQVISLYDARTGKEVLPCAEKLAGVLCVTFSPDGKMLASAGYDNTITLWDTATGKVIRRCHGNNYISFVGFSPDGKMLASASSWEELFDLWDTSTGKRLRSFVGHTGVVQAVVFCPDGKTVISQSDSAGRDNTIRFWKIGSGNELHSMVMEQNGYRCIALSPDGKTLAVGTGLNTIRFWDTTTYKEIKRFDAHYGIVKACAFSPDGKTVATASDDGTARLWNAAGGKSVQTFRGHQSYIDCLAFAPDGKRLATGGWDASMRLWDVKTGKELRRFSGHFGIVPALAFSHKGKIMASGSDMIRLWDPDTGTELRQFGDPRHQIHALAFSPDDKLLASAALEGGPVRLWTVATGVEVRPLVGHTRDARAVAFSPDGRTLASGSWDQTIRLWDVATGKEMRRFGRHRNGVSTVAFSTDGKLLASASFDGTVRLWDVAGGKELRPFIEAQGGVTSIAFSCDGKSLAAAGGDTSVLVWDVESLLREPRPQPKEVLSPEKMTSLWHDLIGDSAPKSYRAIRVMTDAPAITLPFLNRQMQSFYTDNFEQLFADLGDNQFAVRQKATQQLLDLGKLAETALRKKLASQPSLEVKRRVEAILEKVPDSDRAGYTLGKKNSHARQLAALPAVELLEAIGTPPARAILTRLANGLPAAPLTDEASAALKRLRE